MVKIRLTFILIKLIRGTANSEVYGFKIVNKVKDIHIYIIHIYIYIIVYNIISLRKSLKK